MKVGMMQWMTMNQLSNTLRINMTEKETLINHLKTKNINSIQSLWGEAKSFYHDKCIKMGGGYYSKGDSINVILNINNELIRFCVVLLDVKDIKTENNDN